MLKLTYSDSGLHIEQVNAPIDILIAQRVVLAIRAGQALCVQPGRASFLIPSQAKGLVLLEHALVNAGPHGISLSTVDAEFDEISMMGSWLAADRDGEEGMFLTEMAEAIEYLLYDLWQATQSPAYFLA